jgi:DDE superfamily endonuclease
LFDESALSLTPNVRRSWAPVGQPPTLTDPFNWKKASMAAALCYGVRGGGAQLCFHVTAGNDDTDTLIEVLCELRRFLGGEKATLLWDGLPAHRSRAMRAWLATQRSWLVVERRPASAPELHPTEACGPASRPSSWPTSPVRPWPRSFSRPIEGSSGSGAPHSWPPRSCATPAYRSHDLNPTPKSLKERSCQPDQYFRSSAAVPMVARSAAQRSETTSLSMPCSATTGGRLSGSYQRELLGEVVRPRRVVRFAR